jgi:cytochrome c oxidase subunit I
MPMPTASAVPSRANGPVLRAAIAYLAGGFAMFLVMGLLGLLMRLDHAGMVVVSPDWFYRIMTLHGAGMIAAILFAAWGGLCAVLSEEIRVNARGLWIAFVLYITGMGLVTLACLLGRFAAGWTVLHPLPFEGKSWSMAAGLSAYGGYFLTAIALLVVCITVLQATTAAHGGLAGALALHYLFHPRHPPARLPRPAELIATVTAIDSIVAASAGLIYLIPLFALAAGAVHAVDVLFAKNFDLLFGHLMANLCIYVSAGIVYGTLPFYARRPWRTTWPVVLAWDLVVLLMPINYSHHLYQDFVQPFGLQVLAQLDSLAVGLPSFIVTIVGALAVIYGAGLQWSVPSILIVLGIWGWVFGGLGALLDSVLPVNQLMHNTLWVPAHFHTYFILGAAAFAWAYLYHLLAELSGKPGGRGSCVAAWLYGVGALGFVIMFFVSGAYSVPRRYAVHLPEWQAFARIAVPFVVLLALALAWLAADVLVRLQPAWRRTSETSG